MFRIAILSTHPIQYNAPWFALLNRYPEVETKVFYTWSQRQYDLEDRDFRQEVDWDIPLLEGYGFSFIENTSRNPGNHSFWGIRCPDLIGAINRWNPSHLLVIGWNFHAHLKAMRHFKGRIPVLFRGDSTLLDTGTALKTQLRSGVLKMVYKNVDAALPVGASNRAYYTAHGLKRDQLFFAPHAIDNDRFRGGPENGYKKRAEHWKKELGIPDEAWVVLFVGKLIPKKDPFILVRAFLDLIAKRPGRAKLIITGSGPLGEAVKSHAGENKDIVLLPFQNQSEMPVIYRLGDVLCLPSAGPGETWGLAVNEAMASGTRCLISDKAGCAADLGTYEGNRTFRSGNADDLTEKLAEMLNGHGNRNRDFDNSKFLQTWNYDQLIRGIIRAAEYTMRK